MTDTHSHSAPSDWVRRWCHLIGSADVAAAAGMSAPHVLDLACGCGRHSRWLAARGLQVTALDRDAAALACLADLLEPADPAALVRTVQADLENAPWPLSGQRFDAVLVTNYLWRALWPELLASLKPGAVLIYETFAHGQERLGRPSRPEFLLQSAELLHLCQGLQVVAFEDGWLPEPARFVQRICAIRALASAQRQPARYFLNPGLQPPSKPSGH